jgi:hypothetical protein
MKTITLTGTGRIWPHTTYNKQKVPNLQFTASHDFTGEEDRVYPANHFDNPYGGEHLLDWNNKTQRVDAKALHLDQPLQITIERNAKGYWNILNINILGPCQFKKDCFIQHQNIKDFPHQELIPENIKKQIAENDAILAKEHSPFATPIHGPWTTPTGKLQDLVPHGKPRPKPPADKTAAKETEDPEPETPETQGPTLNM